MIRSLIRLAGILLALPLLSLVTLAWGTPITSWGAAYLAACSLLAIGMIVTPHWRRLSLAFISIGLVSLIGLASTRLISITQHQAPAVEIVTLPSGQGTHWIDALIPEQDSVLFGEAFMRLLGGVTAQEHTGLAPAMQAAYAEMDARAGLTASPVVSTYLGLQQPSAFDAVLINPKSDISPQTGVIFLHGFMGNVTLQCWELAQAAQTMNALTVCPSTGWIGDWWTPQGEGTIHATFQYLRELGIQRIYLGGFSNGGGGLGRLVSNLANEEGLNGLFFIAGVSNSQAVKETGLSVLVIQGTNDERMPVAAARQFASELGEAGTYVELEADHFLIVKQAGRVQAALATWLGKQETGQ